MMLIPMQEKSQKKLPRVRGVVQSTPPLTESPTETPCSVVSVYGKDISTPAERKKMSRVRIGRRHSQVAAIDNLMDEYWQLGDHWTTTNCNEKSIKLYANTDPRAFCVKILRYDNQKPPSNIE